MVTMKVLGNSATNKNITSLFSEVFVVEFRPYIRALTILPVVTVALVAYDEPARLPIVSPYKLTPPH